LSHEEVKNLIIMACILQFVMQPIHMHTNNYNPAPAHTCYSIVSAKALITSKSSIRIDSWQQRYSKQTCFKSLRFLIKKSHRVFLTSSPRNTCQIQQCYLLPPLLLCTSYFFSKERGNRTKSFDSFGGRTEEQRVLPLS